jgi:hypothetical protein
MSITVEIPGGKATFRSSPEELTARRKRPVELIGARIGQVFGSLPAAARILVDGEILEDRTEDVKADGTPLFAGPAVDLTVKQIELLSMLNDAVTWMLLESWTLDLPLPESPDAILDLPGPLYDALRTEAAKINAEVGDGGFTADSALPTDADVEPDFSLPTSA